MSNLSYTDLDSNSIQLGLDEVFSNSVTLENYKDSSNMKIVTDVVKAMVDINNYNIERRAEEAYPDTSVLDDSAIGMAHLLGYSVKQPKPAISHVTITVKGGCIPSNAVYNNQTISFKKWFKVQFNDTPYVFKNAYIIQLTESEFNSLKVISNSLVFDKSRFIIDSTVVPSTELIDIAQGEFKEVTFDGTTQKGYFQVYELEDDTFSDYYGVSDINYSDDIVISEPTNCYDNFYTYVGKRVSTDAIDYAKSNPFHIDRRTLSRIDLVQNNVSPKVCMIRSRRSGGVEILFGGGVDNVNDTSYSFSGGFSQRGNGEILVKYFSTLGSGANRSDVIGKNLNLVDEVYLDGTSTNISSYITVSFNRSVYNGTDRESKDSIKLNAPSSFSSGNRLVTKKDYESYLKGMTIEGKKIYGAVAWSENEEVKGRRVRAVKELANRALFSVVSGLYEKDSNGDWNYVVDIDKSIIETAEEYNRTYSEFKNDEWYVPIFTNPFIASYFTDDYFATAETPSVSDWTSDMDDRSMLTVRNKYVTPIIRKVELTGNVYIGSAESMVNVSKKVKNVLYSYFDTISNFKKPIMLSNVSSLIESNPSVKFIKNLSFISSDGIVKSNSDLSEDSFVSEVTYGQDVDTRIKVLIEVSNLFGNLNEVVTDYSSLSGDDLYNAIFKNKFTDRYVGIVYKDVENIHKYLFSNLYKTIDPTKNITSRQFNDEMKLIITNTYNLFKNETFRFDLFTMYNNILSYVEKMLTAEMIDGSGVVGYTSGNEIVQVIVNLSYVYGN